MFLGDNQAGLCLLNESCLTQQSMRSETIDCRLRHWVDAKRIAFQFFPTNESRADCLTKALPKPSLLNYLAGMVMGYATVNGETTSIS